MSHPGRTVRSYLTRYAASEAGEEPMTQFDREHELVVRVASAHTALWPAASPLRVLRAERGYGRGVADLMILDFDPTS